MAKKRVRYVAPSAAIDWFNLKAAGQPLETDNDGAVVIRASSASRVAVGVADPGTSDVAGVALAGIVDGVGHAGPAVLVVLGAAAAAQNIWVQVKADQVPIFFEIDDAADGPVIIAIA